ncbi:MAG: glycosyl hydrolase family 18 protein, partial [Eubacteriales bacterium]
MKRIIPVFIAIVLIIAIGAFSFGVEMIEQIRYSSEEMDMNEYYEMIEKDDVAIILHDEVIETKAKLIDGQYYLDFPTVQSMLNDRFYEDYNEELLLYTTANDTAKSSIGTTSYSMGGELLTEDYTISLYQGEILYVALEYVQKFTNFSFEGFENPNRIQLNMEWGTITQAEIVKDTNVRYQGGVKSNILRAVEAGETVTVLEEMETWVKVKTSDSIIGYVEKTKLSDRYNVEQIPVTDYVEEEYTSLTKDTKINLGWHQVMSADSNSTISEVIGTATSMNVISPTWFSLTNNDGSFSSIASQWYVDYAHERGIEVWALIDNFNTEVSTNEVLSYTSTRAVLIENLVQEVLAYNIDGINIDFEEVGTDVGQHYIQFIRELSVECRANGIVLSIDNYVPTGGNSHYHREEQGVVADYVIIMGYDEHWGSGGVAGSVASIGFVEDGITQTLEEVPANKVI